MAQGRSALRSGGSVVVALVIAAALTGAVVAAPPISQRAGTTQRVGAGARTTQPASAPQQRLSQPALTDRAAHARGSVDVRRMAAKKPIKRPQARLPFLRRPGATSGGPKGGPKVGGPKVVGPPPTTATTNTDGPAIQTGFAGLATTSFPATNAEPPDPWVAAGPEHVVQAVNLELQMTDRQGAEKVSVDLPTFFLLPNPPATFDSDPHVIYDSVHGRWLATEVSWDCQPSGGTNFGTGYLDVAASRTSDPTGLWDVYYTSFPDQLPDYPAPGTSTDKIAIASNVYDMAATPTGGDCLTDATFAGGDIEYADWADLLNGGNYKVKGVTDPNTFTPRVAVQVPATSATLQGIVGVPAGSLTDLNVGYFTVTGSVANNTIATQADWDLTASSLLSPFTDPPQPLQPGGSIANAIDLRPTDAIWEGSRLVFVSTYPCGTAPRDCVRVTELNTTGADLIHEPTVTQDFVVGEAGTDLFMGGVGLSGSGTIHVGWTRSSATPGDFPSSYAAHQVLGDTPASISPAELLAAGTAAYGGNRWGDYVGIAQDPQVPSQVWNANEYSVGAPGWATMVTPLRPAGATYKPIASVRVLDTRSTLGGLKGGFTANTPRSWQVTNGSTIPNNAVAVTGNVTVTGQTAAGYVAVTVTSTASPSSSTINFPAGETRANNVTIPLTGGGRLSAVYKAPSGKKTQLLFDVTGFFVPDDTGTRFKTLATPARALDSRKGTGLSGPFSADHSRTLVIGGGPTGVPIEATAIAGNLTIVGPTKAGFVAVTRTPTNNPSTSTINVPAGTTRANGVFAALDPTTHALSIVYRAPTGAKTNILLDITGYFVPGSSGLRFVPMTPSRIMDSRATTGLSGIKGKFSASVPKTLPVQGHWGVPTDAKAVTGNLTVTGQTAAGYVSETPNPTASPPTSTINFPLGDTMANGIVAPLSVSGNGSFVYKAPSGKTTALILDLSGYFE